MHLACYGPIACEAWDPAEHVLSLGIGAQGQSLANALRRRAVTWIILGGGISAVESTEISRDLIRIHLRARMPNPPPPIADLLVGIRIPTAVPATLYILGGN
jgi:hypothetical protein